MFFTVTVKWFVVKHKRNKLTFLATLLAWAMSSLILRMLVVTLFTGFFSSTTFSLSSSSGTSTFRFSTAGQIREHEQKLAYDFFFFLLFSQLSHRNCFKHKLFTCFLGRCNSIFVCSSRVLVVSHVVSPLLHFVVDGSDGLKHLCWAVQSLFCHFQGKVQTLRGSVWKRLQIDEKQKYRELNSVSEYFSLMKEDYWRLKTDSDMVNKSMTIWNTEKRQFSFVDRILLKGQNYVFLRHTVAFCSTALRYLQLL